MVSYSDPANACIVILFWDQQVIVNCTLGLFHTMRNQRFNAKLMASRISLSFSFDKEVIIEPTFDFDTVWIWSQLMAQSFRMPSRRDKITSLGISLIVEVTGAIVTSPKYSKMEFLVKITTGRFLSGCLNLYHLTSPRFTNHPILALTPRR